MTVSLTNDWPQIVAFVLFVIYTIRNEQKIKYLLKKIAEIEEDLTRKQDRLEAQFEAFVTGVDSKLTGLIVSVEILMDRDKRSRRDDWSKTDGK